MSDVGRVPLWMVATVGGLAAGGLLILFVFGFKRSEEHTSELQSP